MRVRFNGKGFKAVRKQRHISQITLAEQTETTERYLRELENGRMDNPSAAMVYRFSVILNQPMEAFMIVEEDPEL